MKKQILLRVLLVVFLLGLFVGSTFMIKAINEEIEKTHLEKEVKTALVKNDELKDSKILKHQKIALSKNNDAISISATDFFELENQTKVYKVKINHQVKEDYKNIELNLLACFLDEKMIIIDLDNKTNDFLMYEELIKNLCVGGNE